MTEPASRNEELFFEVFESLPRQGPGSRECAARALALCSDLPAAPEILDLGCGVGGQTLHLSELTSGHIVAVDSHVRSIEGLAKTVAARNLSGRVQPMVADMAATGFPPESFDLIWSEGAFYNIGIEVALGICRVLLRPGGYLVFTDAVWRKKDPPEEVLAAFADYPGMGFVDDIIAIIDRSGLGLVGHFTLPDEAWWTDFYNPMERRVQELQGKYASDVEALEALEKIGLEPKLHRLHSECYDYEFFVVRR